MVLKWANETVPFENRSNQRFFVCPVRQHLFRVAINWTIIGFVRAARRNLRNRLFRRAR